MILCFVLCLCTCFFSVLCSHMQMSPTKHSASKKPTSKCACADSDNFKSMEADLKYNDCYKRATIIMERVVKLETLKDTFIPEVFKERTWKKLLNPVGVVYSEIVREFFSNASVEGDRTNCWVRHKELNIILLLKKKKFNKVNDVLS